MKKFTDRYLASLKPRSEKYDVLESDGFTIRVYPSGRKTFCFRYRKGGKLQRLTIGPYPAMKLSTAREHHQRLLGIWRHGQDPAEKPQDCLTVEKLVEKYIKEQCEPNKRTWEQDQRALEANVVPAWGQRPAAEITRSEVIALLQEILQRGAPRQSNILLTMINSMYRWAVAHDLAPANPCLGVTKLAKDKKKTRYLSHAEITRFWKNLELSNMSEPFKRALRLVLVTAQRPGEVLAIHRREIEGDWWTIPGERTKNGKAHRVYLSPLAQDLLGKGEGFLLASSKGVSAVSSLDHALRRSLGLVLQKTKQGKILTTDVLKVVPFTPHDLRRTAATGMGGLGFNSWIIGKVLNHSETTITGVYNLHEYDKEKQEVLSAWGGALGRLI